MTDTSIERGEMKPKSRPITTTKQIEAIKRLPSHKKKYTAGDGLYLNVQVNGGMYWQWKVRLPKETIVSYGTYPEVGLAEAREKHRAAKTQAAQNIHPNVAKRQGRLASSGESTFEELARDWHKTKVKAWSASYAKRWLRRLEMDVFPFFRSVPISKITGKELLAVMRKIQARGALETAYRALESCNQVFDYAVSLNVMPVNPYGNLSSGLEKAKRQHMAAFTKPEDVAGFLRAVEGYAGTYIVRAALQLTPMLMVRPGELREASWSEIDLNTGLWTIPAERMKRDKEGKESGVPHLVQLPRQAMTILKELHLRTGPHGLVFKGEQDHARPMSENTINAAIRRLGFCTKTEVTAHGFRATARSLIEQELKIPANIIELQLAHTVKDSLGRAYNRAEHLESRAKMLQQWADYLDGLVCTGKVLRFPDAQHLAAA